MYCSKCGKEIADEALICPGCGCATANYQEQTQAKETKNSPYSQDYLAIKEFEDKVKGIHGLSIVSLILFLGVGIVFSIIGWAKIKQIRIPEVTTENPNELAILRAAKRKLRTALNFSIVPMIPLCILGGMYAAYGLISVGESGGLSILLSLFSIVLLMLGPAALHASCTNHIMRDIEEILKNKQ